MFHESHPARGSSALLAATVAAFTAALVLAPPALAQQGQQGAQQAPDIEVSDDELQTFAEAHLDVQEVRAEMEEAIQSAEDPETAQTIQQQSNRQMAAVIQEEHGMEVDRYTQIARAINQDPELHREFQSILDELTDDEGGPME